MTRFSREDVERHLERLPREAWDRPTPPPPPWPDTEPAGARRRRGLFLRPLAAAGTALTLIGIGVGAGLLIADEDEGGAGTAAVVVDLAPPAGRGGGASGEARVQPRPGGDVVVELSGLRPSGPGDFYELWLLDDDGRLVSLGSLRVPESGRATVDVQTRVDPARFRFLDVSRERADGDPSHSTDSVLRGPLS